MTQSDCSHAGPNKDMILLVGKRLYKSTLLSQSNSAMVHMRFLAVGYTVSIIMSGPALD